MSQVIATIKLNTTNAKRVGTSEAITEKGAYMGRFTRAEAIVSDRGTVGIEFDFKTDDGRSARYLTTWLQNSDGKELGGRKVIDGILTCLKVREVQALECSAPKYDAEAREERDTRMVGYPSLVGKPIGLVLAREEYEPNSGGTKWKNTIVCPYEPGTRRLPVEILDNKTAPELLDKLLERLTDRPVRPGRNGNSRNARPTPTGGGGGGFDDMDDDIPFMDPLKSRAFALAT